MSGFDDAHDTLDEWEERGLSGETIVLVHIEGNEITQVVAGERAEVEVVAGGRQ